MRALVLLLLLSNLLFLAWTQWLAPRNAPTVPETQDTGVPTLLLASEAQKQAAEAKPDTKAQESSNVPDEQGSGDMPGAPTETAEAVPDPELLSNVARCVSIGSFLTLPDATQASATLRGSGYEPRIRGADGEVWAGLWVYLRALPSRTEARRVLGLLKQRGIKDAYVMPAAAGGSDISLGVFADPARAQRRAEEVRALGFTPTVADRTRRDRVYWIDVDLKPTDAFIDPAALQAESGRIVRLELQACPASAS